MIKLCKNLTQNKHKGDFIITLTKRKTSRLLTVFFVALLAFVLINVLATVPAVSAHTDVNCPAPIAATNETWVGPVGCGGVGGLCNNIPPVYPDGTSPRVFACNCLRSVPVTTTNGGVWIGPVGCGGVGGLCQNVLPPELDPKVTAIFQCGCLRLEPAPVTTTSGDIWVGPNGCGGVGGLCNNIIPPEYIHLIFYYCRCIDIW